MSSAFEAVIGLEVHAQLLTTTKLFCPAEARFTDVPNTHIGPVTLGLPGALPAVNEAAIRLAVMAGLALGCDVQRESIFARKHYFYPDLPKGYQISQFDRPLNVGGYVDIEVAGKRKRVTLERIHVEEDAAKNLHGVGSASLSHIDFNRAGIPLIEIVSNPDMASSEEAEAYLRSLREILMFAGVNDGNLEEGSFRCDANVSIRPVGSKTLGTRTELKNINSFRFVRKAIDYEIARQESVIVSGGQVVQETRSWNENEQKTVAMRSKEFAHDYRYFPDPDLPPLVIDETLLEHARVALPELPEALRTRWKSVYGLSDYDAGVLSAHPGLARFFESTLAHAADEAARADAAKPVANYLQSEVLREVSYDGLSAQFPVTPKALFELVSLVMSGELSSKLAKQVYAELLARGGSPKAIVAAQGLSQISDRGELLAVVQDILTANPDKVAAYRQGKLGLKGFFVGQVMQRTAGRANPQALGEVLDAALAGDSA